jgi:hypothetical protein
MQISPQLKASILYRTLLATWYAFVQREHNLQLTNTDSEINLDAIIVDLPSIDANMQKREYVFLC